MPEHATKSPPIYPLTDDLEPSTANRPAGIPDQLLDLLRPGSPTMRHVDLLEQIRGPQAALQELQRMVLEGTDPGERAHCYVRAGQIRERMGALDAARACYEEAVSLQPEDGHVAYFALNNLAYCLNRQGRYQEAEPLARRAVAIFPDRVNAHKNLGVALEGVGRSSEAADSLLEALRIDPNHAIAMRRIRVLLDAHPDIGCDRPELAREVEALLSQRKHDWPSSKPVPAQDLERSIRNFLSSIEVDEMLVEGQLQVFGLVWPDGDGPDYRTLDEAIALEKLEVKEVSQAGSVPRIRVINHLDTPIFLMAGEQLVGAKQNRVLNVSILLSARADLELPVSCVEQGRWSYRGPRFESKQSSSHYGLRAMMAKKVHESYRVQGTPDSDQREVWGEVARMLSRHQTESPSGALDAIYEKEAPRLDQATERLQPRVEWSGAVFCLGDRIVGLDLFDRPATLQKQWAKLTRAYALDVLDRKEEPCVPRNRVSEWIRGSASALIDLFPSTGLGVDCRLESNRHFGAILVVGGRPVHLEMFYEEEL